MVDLVDRTPREFDVLIVGAGFGAFTTIHKLRKFGLKCKIYEKAASSGGIWYWNQYPGARVDSDTPIYQLFDEELWRNFSFKERYSGWRELKRYFDFVEEKWDLKKDIVYNKAVEEADWDEGRKQWCVKCADGSVTYARWFIPAVGFAAKKYTPSFKGVSDFEGELYHTAAWPQWGAKLEGKRIAVIGTGASGIQTIQETGAYAKHLTMYQRTPNMCLPMNQCMLDLKTEDRRKNDGEYKKIFEKAYTTFAGFAYDFSEKNTFDDSPEERKAFYDELWYKGGGFQFWLATYKDMLFDPKSNMEAYNYWREQVCKRISDPKKAAILAPEEPPHPWGTKRPSLEQNFYEVVSQDHVDVVDLNADPIECFTEKGIKTKSGEKEFDMIIFATGFDAVTGSLAQLGIRGTDGRPIKDHWSDGVRTSIGIAMAKFPNMFFLYGPQAPTAFSNGPSCVQVQADWLNKLYKKMLDEGVTRLEPTEESVDDWCKRNRENWNAGLFPQAKSWYQGSNIPGKKIEPLNWSGGIPVYIESLDKSLENDFQGWTYEKK